MLLAEWQVSPHLSQLPRPLLQLHASRLPRQQRRPGLIIEAAQDLVLVKVEVALTLL